MTDILETDVFICGGGPAGSLSAIAIGKLRKGSLRNLENLNIVLAEEHQSAGFPVECAGLISEDCFNSLSEYINVKAGVFVNKIKGAFVFSPSGNFIKMIGKSKAVVVNRKIMDLRLLMKASEYAKVLIKTKALFVDFKNSKHIIKLKNFGDYKICKADYLIGADGCESIVAKCLSFERPKFLSAAQVECEFESFDDNMVELYFGEKYSDCMFGYSIPLGDGISRIGVVCENNAIDRLKYLLKKHPSVSERVNSNIVELNCGAIPIGLVDFVKDKAVLIGDSSGMVKPYTGGGLYYLLKAAELLGLNFPDLKTFKKEYIKEMGREYSAGMKILKLYKMLTDKDYEFIIKTGKDYEDLLSNFHMDKPSTLISAIPFLIKFLSKPSLSIKIAKCLLS